MRTFVRCLCLTLACIAGAMPAHAHDPGLSRSELQLFDDRVELRVAFHESDIRLALQTSAGASLSDATEKEAWRRRLALSMIVRCIEPHGNALVVRANTPRTDQGNGLFTTLTAQLKGCRRIEVSQPLLASLLPGHRQIMVVINDTGASTDTRVLTASADTVTAFTTTSGLAGTDAGSIGASWGAMIGEGVHHILIGYDHLAFLLVLLLAVLIQSREGAESGAITARHLLVVITAFTAAHSVTLGLSATGLVRMPGAPVEALIALSIVIGGLLNLSRSRRIEGAWLAFGFGLIHGFGFASAFAALSPEGEPVGWLTVAQFNLGVELGQLTVGLPAFAAGLYVMNHLPTAPRLARQGSAAAAGLGLVWFLQRTVLA